MRNRILFSFLAWVAVIVSVQGKQKDFVLQSGQPVAICLLYTSDAADEG